MDQILTTHLKANKKANGQKNNIHPCNILWAGKYKWGLDDRHNFKQLFRAGLWFPKQPFFYSAI